MDILDNIQRLFREAHDLDIVQAIILSDYIPNGFLLDGHVKGYRYFAAHTDTEEKIRLVSAIIEQKQVSYRYPGIPIVHDDELAQEIARDAFKVISEKADALLLDSFTRQAIPTATMVQAALWQTARDCN